ncbi:MAG TPA: sn-glycerol-3-phosphate ABC transporter ATP-binding protein UgpC [Geminicoccus sp.]|uniref:ABC transporter ATP-binding protein n=1 Tax=Geminicoccus sp. TaxID=2024832 RepID=UPI002E2F777D|nr:sn-glycerol-3-phosphate ABC transporter ATP-binding protein UgpC [Geminicoccus sp.]HEX2525148.1 sn-glycerol-3-phosphate ABC transporter ATP-binding protein UgpC [Geminicoccus sp.]
MASLDIEHIGKRFGTVEVLKDIHIGIGHGDFLVLVGPSGCGKSTLLNIIAGLDTSTSGAIKIDGKAVNHLEPKERDIAMVFQSYALYPSMTVGENIGFSLEMAGMPKEERRKRIAGVADLLKIGHLLDRRPSQLSGGQRQRVAMGRALVREPKIFLFDEPLSNLDAKLRVEMRTEIKKLHARLGATIVYVTHDQIEAMTMATRIAVMKDGILQQFGTPADIYDRPANSFVATFMGSPAMNLLDGEIVARGNSTALRLDGVQGDAAILPIPATADPSALTPGQKVTLGLRPEWIAEPGTGRARDVQSLPFTIDVLEPTGPDIFLALRLGTVEIMGRLPADAQVREGETRILDVDYGKAVLFDRQTGTAIYAAPALSRAA